MQHLPGQQYRELEHGFSERQKYNVENGEQQTWDKRDKIEFSITLQIGSHVEMTWVHRRKRVHQEFTDISKSLCTEEPLVTSTRSNRPGFASHVLFVQNWLECHGDLRQLSRSKCNRCPHRNNFQLYKIHMSMPDCSSTLFSKSQTHMSLPDNRNNVSKPVLNNLHQFFRKLASVNTWKSRRYVDSLTMTSQWNGGPTWVSVQNTHKFNFYWTYQLLRRGRSVTTRLQA